MYFICTYAKLLLHKSSLVTWYIMTHMYQLLQQQRVCEYIVLKAKNYTEWIVNDSTSMASR